MMMRKLFLLFVIVFSLGGVNAVSAYDEDEIISNKPEPDPIPSLKIQSNTMISASPGDEFTEELIIKNASSFYAYNVLIQAEAGGSSIPYEMEFENKSNVKHSIQNTGYAKAYLKFKIDKNAATGTYPITLHYSFTNRDKQGFTGEDQIFLKITNNQNFPVVVLNNFEKSREKITAGENVTVKMELENTGKLGAREVQVALTSLSTEGITLYKDVNMSYFPVFDQGFKKTLSFEFTSNPKMETGSYPAVFKVTYKDVAGTEYSKEYTCYINVEGKEEEEEEDKRSNLVITNMEQPSGVYGVNQIFNIKMTVKNSGENDASNIIIKAKTPEGNIIVPRSADTVSIASLKVGQSAPLTFSFSPTNASRTKNYSIGFDVEYETGTKLEDKTKEKYTFSQYAGVNVTNPEGDAEDNKKDDEKEEKDDEKKSTPKIIVSKYVCSPLIVEAGKKFDLALTFKNTHAVKTANNIKLFLTAEDETEEKGNVFSPDNSSNTFYIDTIPPKGEVSHTFKMFAVPDAKPRTYTLKVNFEYEDNELNTFETTELVGINVKQSAGFDTSDIVFPEFAAVGEPLNIGFELYNTGKVTLSNFMIRAEGDFDTAGATLYIGDFASGSSEYYEGVITPTQAGECKGKLIISYDDTDGEHKESIRDFTINAEEAAPVMNPDEMGEEPIEEEGMSVFTMAVIGAAAAVVIAGVVFVIIRRRKKRRMLDNDGQY